MTSLNQMPSSYDEFLLQNRKYINASFLYIILTCILTGPAIGLGIYAGIFTHTSYGACVIISVGMLILYFGCLYMYKKWPYKAYTSFLAIFVMNILLVYMSYEKINVNVTWFLMPLLSMLLLSSKIYIISCLFNYAMILLSIWLTAPYMSAMSKDETVLDYFKYEAAARTIETFIMAVVGYEIGRLISFYYRSLIEDKQKENVLLKMALTDELTKLGNRRCLDLDVAEFNNHPIPDNICVMSFDLNGLKITNDTWGHRAGDELINGAVQCILKAMERFGKLYRTGGDEFVAIIFARNFRLIEKAIIENAENWRGENNNRLALSIGVASRIDYPDASIAELQKISDEIMYKNKEEYYKENGIDRNALYNKYQEQ